jgi:hypothetical protein
LNADEADLNDPFPYRADEMEKYGTEFLAKIEPSFI